MQRINVVGKLDQSEHIVKDLDNFIFISKIILVSTAFEGHLVVENI